MKKKKKKPKQIKKQKTEDISLNIPKKSVTIFDH